MEPSNVFEVEFVSVEVHHGSRTAIDERHTDSNEVRRHDHGSHEDAVGERRFVVNLAREVLVVVTRERVGLQQSFEERVWVGCVVEHLRRFVVTRHHHTTQLPREGVPSRKQHNCAET